LVKRVPFALAISIWALCALAQDGVETFDAKRFEAFRDHAFAREADRDWMKIAWQPDMDAGLEAARVQKKPILVVLVVGHRGERGVPEC
jgi:hypothetical protein